MNGNLLETILADADMLAQLERAGSTRQTITLDIRGKLSTPTGLESADFQETVELPFSEDVVIPPHHLPERTIVPLGKRGDITTDYRLVGALGRGGTAVVYQAHQRAVDREVAVKVLRDELASDPLARERFLAEAKTVGSLDHPNVIALHELAASDSGQLFYSMKRIDGTSWAEAIEDRSIEENLTILLRVSDAIRYAHSRGLLHRDIKPENVMLGRFGEVLVADWGLALSYPIPRPEDLSRSIGGTPAYMAPELAAASLDCVGVTTDVYLLGAVLFQVLTGLPPHHGETLVDCIHAAARNEIRPSRVTGALMDIAMRAMATKPEDRYQDVEAFQQAILAFQQHQESVRLVNRARRHAEEANAGTGYEKFGLAINLLSEALEVWPDNDRAALFLKSVRTDFARRAVSLGDYDLAIDMLDSAGEGNSEFASRVRRSRSKRQQRIDREARLNLLFSHSPDPVLLTRIDDGSIVEANEVFLGRFGFELEAIIGKSVPDLNLWVCPKRRSTFVEEIRTRGRIDNFEARFRDSQGQPLDVLISGRKVKLEEQELLVTNLRDITLRKSAEDELRRSRQRLREFTRLAKLGTWEFDVASGTVYWNSELYALTGIERGEQAPSLETFIQTIHPEDRQSVREQIKRAMESGEAYEAKVRHRLPCGGYRTVITRGQPIRDADHRVIEIYGTVHDITAEHAEIAQGRELTRAMQQLVDYSGEPLLAIDANGRVLAASSALAALVGTAAGQLRCQWTLQLQPDTLAYDDRERHVITARLHHPSQPPGAWMSFEVQAAAGKGNPTRLAKYIGLRDA